MKKYLPLPTIAPLGFFEVLILMFVMVWFAGRYYKKHQRMIALEPQTV